MKCTVIPSGFKESLSAEEVGYAIKKGIHNVSPTHDVHVIPMVDGGEGFVETMIKVKNGYKIKTQVTGPIGKQISSFFGVFKEDGQTVAVIEMAAIAGLRHVPKTKRNPLYTTTYGVGETILKALDYGVDRILIGCGDSGTSDGGIGMAQAIGVQLFDAQDALLHIQGAADIHKIAYMDLSGVDPRIQHTQMDVAVNWTNVLCGENGVARVFGPQKGATSEEVEHLSANLEHLATLIERETGKNLRTVEGSGASGGLGAGLSAFANATLHPRFDVIMTYINVETAIKDSDVVITAEGCIDDQTPNGKIPAEVARIAKTYDKPVVALAGTIGKNAKRNYQSGIDAFSSIIPGPTTLDNAIEDAEKWLEGCAESVIRHITIGMSLIGSEQKFDASSKKVAL
ncbi:MULTISPECIES: glycerate kinase [Staphylococcus]|nr:MULTISPECIES: glycerate kinase [Staphylococcus]NHM92781.1 glycerate kinase [Staphylococcus sp. 10602379]NJI13040.1 glycerate kinase [Staphylococcus agnetis]PTH14008.1 glycerate kinase [Staphylococcus agnetis]PTH28521.1 glycerate kinase [Staphylococcus agnetis]PTH36290.1 glycerate kinase [Staphylococcus agnetis]